MLILVEGRTCVTTLCFFFLIKQRHYASALGFRVGRYTGQYPEFDPLT